MPRGGYAFLYELRAHAELTGWTAPPSVVLGPPRPADLYTLARSLRAAPAGRGRVDPVAGVRAALARGDAGTVLITTTRRAHLEAHLAAAGLG